MRCRLEEKVDFSVITEGDEEEDFTEIFRNHVTFSNKISVYPTPHQDSTIKEIEHIPFYDSSNLDIDSPNIKSENLEESVESYVPKFNTGSLGGKIKMNLAAVQGSLMTIALPTYIILEKGVLGMSDYTSQNTRAMALFLGFSGLISVYNMGRENLHSKVESLCHYFSKKFDDSKRKIADLAYGGLFTAAVNPIAYSIPALLTNTFNIEEASKASLLGLSVGACMGVFMGWGVDLFQDLWGYKKSERIAEDIRSLPLKAKRLVANGLCAVSLTLSSFLYGHADNAEYGGEPAGMVQAVETYYGQDLSLQGQVDYLHGLRIYPHRAALKAITPQAKHNIA